MGEREKEKKNEHGLPNTASHKLQGEKEENGIILFSIVNYNKWANHRNETKN